MSAGIVRVGDGERVQRRDVLIGRVIDKLRVLHRTNDTKFTEYFFNTRLANNFIQQHVLARIMNEMEIEGCGYIFHVFLTKVIAHGRENLFRRLIYDNYAQFIRVLKCIIAEFTDIKKSCIESTNVHDGFFCALRVARSHRWAFTYDPYNEYFDELLLFQNEAYTLSMMDMLYPLGCFNPDQVARVIQGGERFLTGEYDDNHYGHAYCVRQYGLRRSRKKVRERLAIFVDIVSEKRQKALCLESLCRLRVRRMIGQQACDEDVIELLRRTKLPDPIITSMVSRPHKDWSVGERQFVCGRC